jgi:hypothetical protein
MVQWGWMRAFHQDRYFIAPRHAFGASARNPFTFAASINVSGVEAGSAALKKVVEKRQTMREWFNRPFKHGAHDKLRNLFALPLPFTILKADR